ncbi:MAG: hypothetical protein WA869_13455 [Alloacidobacterium sp.]
MQFISDFTINLMDGQLGDYDPKRIASYYKEYDEKFPQEGELADRMEYIFERMVRLPPTDFSDTVFRSAQVTFSLMWLLDEMRDRQITTDQLREVIHRTDAQVTAAQQEELLDPRIVEGFTQGNLHRIRTRRLRHEVLENNLPL